MMDIGMLRMIPKMNIPLNVIDEARVPKNPNREVRNACMFVSFGRHKMILHELQFFLTVVQLPIQYLARHLLGLGGKFNQVLNPAILCHVHQCSTDVIHRDSTTYDLF